MLLQVSFHYSKEVLYVATCETSYNDNKGIAFQYHTTPSDEDSTISGPVSLRSYLSVANYSDKKTKFSFPEGAIVQVMKKDPGGKGTPTTHTYHSRSQTHVNSYPISYGGGIDRLIGCNHNLIILY